MCGEIMIRQCLVSSGHCKQSLENGKEKCVSIKVSANVTISYRKAGATIAGSYSVIEVKTAKMKQSKIIDGKYEFATEWAKYSGDEKALSGEPERLVRVREEKDFVEKLAKTLKDYAR